MYIKEPKIGDQIADLMGITRGSDIPAGTKVKIREGYEFFLTGENNQPVHITSESVGMIVYDHNRQMKVKFPGVRPMEFPREAYETTKTELLLG